MHGPLPGLHSLECGQSWDQTDEDIDIHVVARSGANPGVTLIGMCGPPGVTYLGVRALGGHTSCNVNMTKVMQDVGHDHSS